MCTYGSDFFSTSQNVLRVLQNFINSCTKFVFLGSLARQEGEVSCTLFWKLKLMTQFVGVNAQITGIHG